MYDHHVDVYHFYRGHERMHENTCQIPGRTRFYPPVTYEGRQRQRRIDAFMACVKPVFEMEFTMDGETRERFVGWVPLSGGALPRPPESFLRSFPWY